MRRANAVLRIEDDILAFFDRPDDKDFLLTGTLTTYHVSPSSQAAHLASSPMSGPGLGLTVRRAYFQAGPGSMSRCATALLA